MIKKYRINAYSIIAILSSFCSSNAIDNKHVQAPIGSVTFGDINKTLHSNPTKTIAKTGIIACSAGLALVSDILAEEKTGRPKSMQDRCTAVASAVALYFFLSLMEDARVQRQEEKMLRSK